MRAIRSFRRWWLDRLVLRPSRHPISADNLKRGEFHWSDHRIEFYEHPADQSSADQPSEPSSIRSAQTPSRLVLKFPGTSGRAEKSSRFPVHDDPDAVVWTWNPPGYGSSGGRASLHQFGGAAAAFAKHAAMTFGKALPPIWLSGNSLGCCVALHVAAELAAEMPIRGLVLRNAPPLVPVVMRIAHRYPGGRWMRKVAESLPAAMDVRLSITKVELPIVWILSGNDRLVPPEMQHEVIRLHRGPQRIVVLNGRDHHEAADDAQFAEIEDAIDWLKHTTF
jgi:uncharacterized protein